MKTLEEKRQAARQRAEKIKARAKQLPYGGLRASSDAIRIYLVSGEQNIVVKYKSGKQGAWEQWEVYLDDAQELAGFIIGLVCRYNNLVGRINKHIQACPPMEKLNDLPLPPISS